MDIEYKGLVFITWRKSVFENNFRCNICGQKLIDADGNPVGTIDNYDFMQCRYCRNVVAEVEKKIERCEKK